MAYSAKQKKSDDETNAELLKKLEDNFQSSLDHPTWQDWRKHAAKCHRYKENEQWTPAELAELEKRGQPPTVNNQISVTINRMVGQFVRQNTRVVYKGRNPEDQPAAEVLSDLFRFIRQSNDLEYEEKDQAEDGFTGGFGVLKADVTYDDGFQPRIEMKCVDSFMVLPDPYSRRYDWNIDANYINEAIWVDADDLGEMYPSKKSEISRLMTGNAELGQLGEVDRIKRENWIDLKQRRVRVIEQWYKIKKRQSLCIFQNGAVLDKETNELRDPMSGQTVELSKTQIKALKETEKYEEFDRVRHTLNMGLFCKGVLLEHKETERIYFPYIPYFVARKKSGEPYSLILIALEMQDAINKRESKALDLVTKNQAIYEQGAVTDPVAFALEKAKPDGQMEINKGYMERFTLVNNLELAQGQLAMHAQAKDDFRRITGINPDAMGEKSEMRSGVGVARKQAMTDVIIAPVFDNFRRTRVIQGRVVLELIQQHFTQPLTFYITDNLKAPKEVALDSQTLAAIKQRTYDIIVDEAPDATTRREETLQSLGQVLPAILPFGPMWAEIMFDLVDIPDKDEIKKKVQAASQPPPNKPKIAISAQLDALTPPERAAMWIEMGAPQVAEAVMKEMPNTSAETKVQGDIMKEQAKNQNDGGKAQLEREKHQMEMQSKAFDVQAKQQMTQMEIEKKQMELEMEFQKLSMQIAASREMGNGKDRQATA